MRPDGEGGFYDANYLRADARCKPLNERFRVVGTWHGDAYLPRHGLTMAVPGLYNHGVGALWKVFRNVNLDGVAMLTRYEVTGQRPATQANLYTFKVVVFVIDKEGDLFTPVKSRTIFEVEGDRRAWAWYKNSKLLAVRLFVYV